METAMVELSSRHGVNKSVLFDSYVELNTPLDFGAQDVTVGVSSLDFEEPFLPEPFRIGGNAFAYSTDKGVSWKALRIPGNEYNHKSLTEVVSKQLEKDGDSKRLISFSLSGGFTVLKADCVVSFKGSFICDFLGLEPRHYNASGTHGFEETATARPMWENPWVPVPAVFCDLTTSGVPNSKDEDDVLSGGKTDLLPNGLKFDGTRYSSSAPAMKRCIPKFGSIGIAIRHKTGHSAVRLPAWKMRLYFAKSAEEPVGA